jgi:uncharacterized OsmC-like protein
MTTTLSPNLNGIDTQALRSVMDEVKADHRKGIVSFSALTKWKGAGPATRTHITGWSLGGQNLRRNFTIDVDEPVELLGNNTAPNPQEFLLTAMNSCLAATFVAACAMQDIKLESFEIESTGELDLRGFLGLDRKIKPGYEDLHYTIRVKGNATPEQFEQIHQWMKATSPNYSSMATAIRLNSRMIVQ